MLLQDRPGMMYANLVSAAAVAGTEATITSCRVHYDMGIVMLKAGMWQIEQSGLTRCRYLTQTQLRLRLQDQLSLSSMPLSAGTL